MIRLAVCWCVLGAVLTGGLAQAACDPKPGLDTFFSDGWGIGAGNHRLQRSTSIDRSNAASLELAWAYGHANGKPRSWPLVTEDTIFVGDSGRGVVALDRATGCERWLHEQRGEIGSAILHAVIGGRIALLYLERTSGLYAIDAMDGSAIWHAESDDQPIPMYSGTPVVANGVVYVPLSSVEIGLTLNPIYGCCRTSGGMAAFDLETGRKLWFVPTIPEPAQRTGSHWWFVDEYGPSGAPVWGAPLYDPSRGVLYFGTGQNYSRPTTATSEAIFALAGESGATVWIRQFTADDAYNIACDMPFAHPNCHLPKGPDVDFGAPPMLVRAPDGRELLIAGQKSADIYALDPDTGDVVWHERLGRGGALGGIHWGLAANEVMATVFVPVSDIEANSDPAREPQPGLYALDVQSGAIRWQHLRENRCAERICSGGLSAAITATPDLVVAGSLDGYLEIYDAATGDVLWSDDTWTTYTAVNGIETSGGTFDAHGPMVAGDQVIVFSGYDSFFQKPGNALLVYRVKEGAQQ
jgi:polyvinyl alcohol dehydrogenase (cytochrome)